MNSRACSINNFLRFYFLTHILLKIHQLTGNICHHSFPCSFLIYSESCKGEKEARDLASLPSFTINSLCDLWKSVSFSVLCSNIFYYFFINM